MWYPHDCNMLYNAWKAPLFSLQVQHITGVIALIDDFY